MIEQANFQQMHDLTQDMINNQLSKDLINN